MSGYIISDLNFYNENVAKDLKMNVKDYNKMVIDKWNSAVSNIDNVYVFGQFGQGLSRDLKEIIKQLNGNIYLMNTSETQYKRNMWRALGIYKAWNCGLKSKREDICIGTTKSDDINCYIATAKDNLETVYINNQLSIEAKYWDYTPIEANELINIARRMKEFDKMEGETNG